MYILATSMWVGKSVIVVFAGHTCFFLLRGMDYILGG